MADSRYAGEAGLQAVFGQIKAAMAEKQDKVNGMVLSHNDYSDAEKQKNAQNASDIVSLNSDIDNIIEKMDGDATVYPYADVITIENAVPANLADCTVKIEPVQDLHGFDHPWVGGAYKNKAYVNINSGETALTEIKDNDNNVIGVNADVDAAVGVVTVKMATVSIENGKTYTLSGSPNDKSNSTYRLDVRTQAQGQLYNNWNEIDNPTITATEDVTLDIYLRIAANYAVNNLVFHPQIEEGSTPTTFAPYTNICPITGHTEASVQRDGKNLLNLNSSNTTILKRSGSVSIINANTLSLSAMTNAANVVNVVVPCFRNTDYVVRFTGTNINAYGIKFYEEIPADWQNLFSGNLSGNSGNNKYILLCFRSTESKAITVSDIQIEFGQVSSEFVPYHGKTYTIALGDTIYGGSVDFNSGVMTVTHRIVDLGTLTWANGDLHRAPLPYSKAVPNNQAADTLCEWYIITSFNTVYSDHPTNKIAIASDNGIYLYNEDMTGSELKTYLDGCHLTYELNYYITVNLTPQQIQLLKGTNTLTASTGQISVTVNGLSGSIGAVQEQVNELAKQLPNAPTTDGVYVLTVTVADGVPTYSWESAE